MKQMRSGFNLFVATFFVMLTLCASTPSVFAEDNEVKFSIVAQGHNNDLWWFFVHLKNLSDKEVSINISPTIVDSNEDEYKQATIHNPNPAQTRSRWFIDMSIPKELSFKFEGNYLIRLPPTKAVIIPLSFKLPAGIKPSY